MTIQLKRDSSSNNLNERKKYLPVRSIFIHFLEGCVGNKSDIATVRIEEGNLIWYGDYSRECIGNAAGQYMHEDDILLVCKVLSELYPGVCIDDSLLKRSHYQCDIAEKAMKRLNIRHYVDENSGEWGDSNRTPEALLIRELVNEVHPDPREEIAPQEYGIRVTRLIELFNLSQERQEPHQKPTEPFLKETGLRDMPVVERMIGCPTCERGIGNVYRHGVTGYIGVPCECGYFNKEMQDTGKRFNELVAEGVITL